jgi:hypothetical protein
MVLMGHFYEKLKIKSDYIIYKDFIPYYISFQYSHLVIENQIQLMEIKVKRGESRR